MLSCRDHIKCSLICHLRCMSRSIRSSLTCSHQLHLHTRLARRLHCACTRDRPRRSLVCRHHQRFAIDILGPFVEVDGLKYACHVTDVATGINYSICLPNKEALARR